MSSVTSARSGVYGAVPSFASFGATILTSAFLLFQVEPLIARIILPWFGGSAAVWGACMVFFQVALLAGYAYSHYVSSHLRPRVQGLVHIGLLAISLATLPILPSAGMKPEGGGDPTGRILLLLTATIGLPYLLLSTTGPLVQSWFARLHPGRTPYRLFALSNFGSMLALLSYPVVFEPFFSSPTQAWSWSAGYGVFVVLAGSLAFALMRRVDAAPHAVALPGGTAPGGVARIVWFLLAACPSVLLLAVTQHLTQNISPIPFLWVVPLALYLLSFILCFESDRWYRRGWAIPALLALAAGMALTLGDSHKNTSIWILIPLYCSGLFVASMTCHGELARMRPAPRYLTAFYLLMSIGGAAGGAFVGVVASRLFNDYYELPIALGACGLIAVVVTWKGLPQKLRLTGALIAAVFATVIAGVLWTQTRDIARESVFMARNFYGTLRVVDSGEGEEAERSLLHGTINHGKEFLSADRRAWPTSYYGEDTGVARAILGTRGDGPQRVGVVGLGTGTLTAYSRPGDVYRVYEINPLVERVAREQFHYLGDAKGKVEVVLGDARLSMEREAGQNYDVLAVDAFSSDAIPVHLLTREAFAIYFRQLRPGGVLAVHISNRYLNLAPVVKQAAAHFGKAIVSVENEGNDARGTYGATWLLLADTQAALDRLKLGAAGESLDDVKPVRLWTDDFSNLYELARWRSE